jgi:hypothetical protein
MPTTTPKRKSQAAKRKTPSKKKVNRPSASEFLFNQRRVDGFKMKVFLAQHNYPGWENLDTLEKLRNACLKVEKVLRGRDPQWR